MLLECRQHKTGSRYGTKREMTLLEKQTITLICGTTYGFCHYILVHLLRLDKNRAGQ
jgi:hypothetical protein